MSCDENENKYKNENKKKPHQLHICVATSTRADYGILRLLIRDLIQDPYFKVSILVTGSHVSSEHGYTISEIKNDGVPIAQKVEMIVSADTKTAQAKSLGLGIIGFTDALESIQPDCILILGDRYEMLGLASCALLLDLPVIHLHGGEASYGVIDEAIRHSITKMSWLHFTATEAYRKRVIQLGESPKRVFNVGALGVENITEMQLISKQALFKDLQLPLDRAVIVITYHPEAGSKAQIESQISNLLESLSSIQEYTLVFTMPNADSNGNIIRQHIQSFVDITERAICADSLGQNRYFSLIRYATLVIGNSSSGIIEIPSFQIPSVNIGTRQQGRITADSVIHCDSTIENISKAIAKGLSESFQLQCKNIKNPYAAADTRENIIKILKENTFIDLPVKEFYDLH